MNTGDMLDQLSTIGRPKVGRLDSGWFAELDFPSPKGVSMSCRSDFGHPNHESALIELCGRLKEMGAMAEAVSNLIVPTDGASIIELKAIKAVK